MPKNKKLSSLNWEELTKVVPWMTEDGFDYSKYPIENLAKDVLSQDDEKFRNAVRMIIQMSIVNREDALIVLFGLFEYYKNDIKKLETIANNLVVINNSKFVDLLFNQINNTKSTNTTRIYLNLIIKSLSRYPPELVLEGFEKLLENKSFSYRMRIKFKDIIDELKY
jgi:hypothetical protein